MGRAGAASKKRTAHAFDYREPMVIVPLSVWRKVEELLEDQEALSSPRFRERVRKAREDVAKGRTIRPFH
jgi:PHD/YefM family antitoxin component YafN of YafNO toxin-antitoxin module